MFLSTIHTALPRSRALAGLRFGYQFLNVKTAALSTSSRLDASQRELVVKRLRQHLGSGYAKHSLPTSLVLSTLRDMRIERSLGSHPERFSFSHRQEANMFRDGHRAIALLASGGKERISLGEIESVLTDDNGVTWSTIRELLETGSIKRLEALSDDKKTAVLFHRVHGIGSIKAAQLVAAGYRTLEDLKTIPSNSKLLSNAQRIGLLNLDDMEAMIPRDEITTFKRLIENALANEDPELRFEIMGSYRRGESMSSDIDLVVWHSSYAKLGDAIPEALMRSIMNALFSAKLLTSDRVFSSGDKKLSALTRLPDVAKARFRQIDVRISPVQSLPFMLLGNTGDDELMKILRRAANDKGWTLNEYAMGLKDTADDKKSSTWQVEGTEMILDTEKEIFDLLEVPYLEPTQRSYRDYVKILPRHLI